MSKFRTITADEYRTGDHDEDFDEAFIGNTEIWDVGVNLDEDGKVLIYTSAADPIAVDGGHPIRVR